MDYPSCHFRCNGLLNCQQLDHLLVELTSQNGREDTASFYRAMLKRNFKHCPLNNQFEEKIAVSMY